MNRFSIDLKQFRQTQSDHNERNGWHTKSTLAGSLFALGEMHRKEIFQY
jgi:hypothetical protein